MLEVVVILANRSSSCFQFMDLLNDKPKKSIKKVSTLTTLKLESEILNPQVDMLEVAVRGFQTATAVASSSLNSKKQTIENIRF